MGILKKAISADKDVVFSVIDATSVVSEAMMRIKAYPPAMVHLGQAMMGASLLHSLWNEKGRFKKVSLQWRGNGPFGNLYVESNEKGHVRGTISNPLAPIDNYETSLGSGHLQVRKYEVKESTGIIEAKGNICSDLLEYLTQSEQRNTTMAVSVKIGWNQDRTSEHPFLVEYALGYLIDVLPESDLEGTQAVLKNWDHYLADLGPISQWVLPSENRPEDMLKFLSPRKPVREILYQKVQFHCNCSEDRANRAAQLSAKHAESPPQPGPLEVQCEFCGKIYKFSP